MNFNFLIHEFWNFENSKNNNLDIETLMDISLMEPPNKAALKVDCLLVHPTIFICRIVCMIFVIFFKEIPRHESDGQSVN